MSNDILLIVSINLEWCVVNPHKYIVPVAESRCLVAVITTIFSHLL